jgi:hypothetical protein
MNDAPRQQHFGCECKDGPEFVLLDGLSAGLPTSRGTFSPPIVDDDRHVPFVAANQRNFVNRAKENKQILVCIFLIQVF